MTTATGKSPSTVTNLFVACINLKWPETGDQDEALNFILEHPKIKRKIDFEAKRLTDVNLELDRDDLGNEIKTLLYLAIKNEFNLQLDPQRMAGWLCSRIAWRTLDHVSKECDVVYTRDEANGDPEYRRIDKFSLSYVGEAELSYAALQPGTFHLLGSQKDKSFQRLSLGDQIPADVERHPNFESFLRKAPIKTQHKHVLMYVVIMGYNFRELADVYEVSSPTARKLYKQAVASLKRHILSLSLAEQHSIQNLLRGLNERS